MSSDRSELIRQLKEYRNSLISSKKDVKISKGGKQKTLIKNENKGYMDAIVLALLTGLASGIMIGITLMVTNILA